MFGSWKIYLGIGIIMAVMVGLGYWYFNWSQDRMAQLAADKAKLELSVQEQKKTIESMEAFQKQQAEQINKLQTGLSKAERDKARLAAMLAKHDLNRLARSKPKMIEDRINAASKKILQELGGK